MATVDPYKQYKAAYDAQTKAINAENAAQVAERKQREQTAKSDLANANRGVYTTYKNATNPYGSFASQNNMSRNISDYANNASYSTYLQGLGSNQANYQTAMNNSNALWNTWLAQKAGQEAQNLSDYAGRMADQGNLDRDFDYKKGRDAVTDNQWQLQFDFDKDRDQYQRDRDTIGDQQWQAQFDEDKRRYDQEWAFQQSQAKRGGGGGGGGYRGGGGGGDSDLAFGTDGAPFTGWNEENGYAVEYKDGKKTGKKIKSNTSGGVVNNTTQER